MADFHGFHRCERLRNPRNRVDEEEQSPSTRERGHRNNHRIPLTFGKKRHRGLLEDTQTPYENFGAGI